MRAREFLAEKGPVGKIEKNAHSTLPNVHKFAGTADKLYDLNRAMLIAAMSDGKTKPVVDSESWVGRNNLAVPYTEVEHQMLHHAYDGVGCDLEDMHNGYSTEPEEVNKASPISGFKGYPFKRKIQKESTDMSAKPMHMRFFSKPGMAAMMESYDNPTEQLTIRFRNVTAEYGDHYYEAIVREKDTNKPRLVVNFTLSDNDNSIKVGNIEPILSPEEKGKPVHTSMGSYDGGIDMGGRGVMWLMKQLKAFALSKGFAVSKITSSTRYTGARALNSSDSDDDMPKRFNVDKNLRETVIYESYRNRVTITLKEEQS